MSGRRCLLACLVALRRKHAESSQLSHAVLDGAMAHAQLPGDQSHRGSAIFAVIACFICERRGDWLKVGR